MKKTVTIILLACCALAANAQNFERGAHLHMGQRWPTYYYWGDNWIDRHLDAGGFIGNSGPSIPECKPECARYIYADSSLRVIGIAIGMDYCVHAMSGISHYGHNPYRNYQTEHFRLYEVDSTTNEMILLADKPLTDSTPACYLPRDVYSNTPGIPVFEVYFDSAITVYDSFYVSATCNNNYRRSIDEVADCYITSRLYGLYIYENSHPICFPEPNHWKRKLHLVNGYDRDNSFGITDTNWHTFHTAWEAIDPNHPEDKPDEWPYFMVMFPIIDTTPDHTWLPECKRPVNLGTVHAGREVVVLGWESEGSSQWELKVVKEGADMDSVEPIECTGDVVPLYGLDTATWYAATVRSLCSGDRISDWSDTIRFFVPGDTCTSGNGDTTSTDPTDPTEGIETPAERYTYLMPNPATEQVTVMSSFRIGKVTVYDAAGNRILRTEPNGMSATIDLSTLPSGVYIVSIATNRGTVHKRLIKK